MVRKGRGAVRMAGPGDFLIPNKAIMMIWKNIMAVMMCWKICIHNCTTTKDTISLMYLYGAELGTTNNIQLQVSIEQAICSSSFGLRSEASLRW